MASVPRAQVEARRMALRCGGVGESVGGVGVVERRGHGHGESASGMARELMTVVLIESLPYK